MFSQWTIIAVFFGYLAILFMVALWVERKSKAGVNIGNNPVIYALSFGVYCTTWTYYGSVGKAATSGMLFLTVYLGPTLAILIWWTLLRKMIRLKNVHRITSIADFISARYNKSRAVAALATVIAIVGIIPYVGAAAESGHFDLCHHHRTAGLCRAYRRRLDHHRSHDRFYHHLRGEAA